MNRRTFTAGALGAWCLTSLAAPAAGTQSSNRSWTKIHTGVFFIGSMPWVRLFEDQRETCWASVIQADWSLQGPGRLLILRHENRRRVLGDNAELASWLSQWLLRPTEAERAVVDDFQHSTVSLQIDPGRGLRAAACDIEIEMTEPFERRLIRREPYPLGDFLPTASWVRISCAQARVAVGGKSIPGSPALSTDSFGRKSTAQINVAEVWTI